MSEYNNTRNLLLSAAIGDISGMPYEHNRTKDYVAVNPLKFSTRKVGNDN